MSTRRFNATSALAPSDFRRLLAVGTLHALALDGQPLAARQHVDSLIA